MNKSTEGIYNKKTTFLSTHFCTHKDFLNSHNDSFDRLTLNKYQCLDDYNSNLEGIYSDQIFTYYEFSVVSKYDTPENLNNIEEFLFESDCKMKIIYIEKSIDLNNYMEPIKSYLYDVFVQLNPTLYIKRNMFFVNQYLTNDDDLLGFIDDVENSIITSIYSRYEEYSLYLGLNRSITKPPNYDKYAKIYLRADTEKTVIRRTYQNLMEFYANISSLMIGVLRVLIFILNYFNNFYAEFSFSKRIFIFKDFENSHFNLSKRNNQINHLKSLLGSFNIKETESSSYDSDIADFYSNEKIFGNYELLTYNKRKKINIYSDNNERKRKSISYSEKGIGNIIRDINNSKTKNNMINLSTEKMIFKKEKDSQNSKNIKNTSLTTDKIIVNNKENNSYINKTKNKLELKNEKNKYYINNCEIIIISFCKCCSTPKLKLKKQFHEKINNILCNNLDIVFYIKNMLLIEVMNDVLLNSNNKDVINFLYRPILSWNKKEEKECIKSYENYKDIDFDKFYEKLSQLIQKPDITQKEKQIIFLTRQKLLDLN